MSSNDTDEGEREAKKLRSCEPNLKVVLGESEAVEWHHSQALCCKSKYVDTMLSVPMKEKEEYVISFPDIEPDVWSKMMLYLDNPVAARQMTAKDAKDVALFYDKYEFVEGTKLCDHVIADYMKTTNDMEKKFSLDLELIIELVLVSQKANLDAAFKAGVTYIWEKMTGSRSARALPYGRMMFTEHHLRKLVPILKYATENRESLGLSYSYYCGSLLTSDSVGREEFPREFVTRCREWEQQDLLHECIYSVEVTGNLPHELGDSYSFMRDGAWDEYRPEEEVQNGVAKTARWAGTRVSFLIQYWTPSRDEGDSGFEGWAIVREYPATRFDEDGHPDHDSIVKKLCWISPYSKNLRWPPRRGWVSADKLARGTPIVKYILRECIE